MEKNYYRVEIKSTDHADKFRPAAVEFEKTGRYTSAPRGTKEYREYWKLQIERSIHGYETPDGDYITGYFYFYLNFCPIMVVKGKKYKNRKGEWKVKQDRVSSLPWFYDYDRAYFDTVEEAEEQGKHMVVLKKRGAGYSFKSASMLVRNYYCIPNSRSYAIASEMEFLTKDGLITKAWEMMSFIDQYTGLGKKRQKIDQSTHKRASLIKKNTDGTEIEIGYKSEIMAISLKNDPQKARGKRGKLILWEEAGKFPHLLTAWQIARPSVETDDGTAFGINIAFGTGGSEGSDFTGLKDLFYQPKAYNCLEIENIWDDGNPEKPCGFFVPQYVNMANPDGATVKLMDENGNSNIPEAIKWATKERQKVIDHATDRNAVDRYIAERPFTPVEAALEISGNIFPKKALIQHLAEIRNSQSISDFKQVGELEWDSKGKLKWVQNPDLKDIVRYRLDPGEDKKGAIVIWEHPDENPPYGLYIGGCLTPGEKVIAERGLVNVEDITLNDSLFDISGEKVEIKNLQRYTVKNEDIYEVKLSNTYRTTTFTKEHPIFRTKHITNKQNKIKESLFDFDFVKTEELRVGDWVKYPNLYLTEGVDSTLPEEYWWFIGLWLGDGWCSENRIYISFDTTNTSQLEKFKKFVKSYLKKKVNIRQRGNCIEASFSHRGFAESLTLDYGKGADKKKLPEYIKYKENKVKKNLLLGYLDSDGCVYKDSRGYISLEYVSINLELLEGFQDIAFGLGLIGNLSKLRNAGQYDINGKTGGQKEAYHLRFGHTDSILFATLCDFNRDSKLAKINKKEIKKIRSRAKQGCFLSEDKKYIYFQVKNINRDKYTGIVYNFETTTHTFCAYHIPTHNCDPYDHDKSTTNSLGSFFIYKRFQSFEKYYDMPIAEYTGRPETADEYYENVRKLASYYNATILYENEKKGLFDYFRRKHSEYMLADQPGLIKDIVKNSTVERGKGIHMNQHIKQWGEGEIKKWLIDEFAPGQMNLLKIYSEPLLEELINYNDTGNFDRVMAFMMVVIYNLEIFDINVKKKKSEDYEGNLFSGPIFKGKF